MGKFDIEIAALTKAVDMLREQLAEAESSADPSEAPFAEMFRRQIRDTQALIDAYRNGLH